MHTPTALPALAPEPCFECFAPGTYGPAQRSKAYRTKERPGVLRTVWFSHYRCAAGHHHRVTLGRQWPGEAPRWGHYGARLRAKRWERFGA